MGHLAGQQATAGGPPRRKYADRREKRSFSIVGKKTIVLICMPLPSSSNLYDLVYFAGNRPATSSTRPRQQAAGLHLSLTSVISRETDLQPLRSGLSLIDTWFIGQQAARAMTGTCRRRPLVPTFLPRQLWRRGPGAEDVC